MNDNPRFRLRLPEGAERRAPLAAAAALGVLAGGAAFLAYALSRPTVWPAEPPPSIAVPAITAPASPAPTARETLAPNAESGAGEVAAGRIAHAPDEADEGPGAPPPFLAPRIKPSISASEAASAASTPSVVTLASPSIARMEDRPPPFFFESDLLRGESERAIARAGYDGDLSETPRELIMTLAKGEAFVDALARAGVRAADRNEAAHALGALYNMRRLRPSQEIRLTLAEPNRTFFQEISSPDAFPAYLLALEFRVDAENRIMLKRRSDGAYDAQEQATPLTMRIAAIEGRIDGSLYLSAKRQGAPDEVIAGIAQMFAYDVDFQREIFGGDEFEAIFEVRYDDAGRMVGGGDILYGRLKWRGRQKEKGYYRYDAAGVGNPDYFDEKGESARRLLMKTPVDGARLSSGFGTRKHPVLGYQKAHKGVDFAAPRGTPIMAAGDGVIERAGPYGSFGNYIRIRHAQGYKTAYAHMNSIKRGVRTGVRVRQGDIIGYVGTTGRSTGPHLHYEVHLRDKPVNPQKLNIATGYELRGAELTRFRVRRDEIDALRNHAHSDQTTLAGERNKSGAL
ncbi:MAG: peptidoglycan DD-metalloendopeptidase family protein [Parvularculaceae bacterium]|nr:peptidoglycan DD-metalloendopeptidase family protein [Parvularculaceae bacterium]